MFDIAWSELALIGAVALIVIGPKDLPKVMRTMGQWTRKARLLAGEFQRNVEDMVREAELDEVRRKVQSVTPAAIKEKVETMVDAKEIEKGLQVDPEAAAAAAATVTPPPVEVSESQAAAEVPVLPDSVLAPQEPPAPPQSHDQSVPAAEKPPERPIEAKQ